MTHHAAHLRVARSQTERVGEQRELDAEGQAGGSRTQAWGAGRRVHEAVVNRKQQSAPRLKLS